MNLKDTLVMGVNTTIISMGIVFLVLIALAVLISIQYRILKAVGVIEDKMPENVKQQRIPAEASAAPEVTPSMEKSGTTKGEAKISGGLDEELVAVVMAAVSHASSTPLSELRIRSIRRVDENWINTAKQEMANQRL